MKKLFALVLMCWATALAAAEEPPTDLDPPDRRETVRLVSSTFDDRSSEILERNHEMLHRDVLFFAKRHRFLTLSEQSLRTSKNVTIEFFPGIEVDAELVRRTTSPGMEIWEGKITRPYEEQHYYSYPDRKPLPEDVAKQIDDSRRTIRILATPISSQFTGDGNFRQAVSVTAKVPDLRATYVLKSLPNDPLIHVAYELDPDRCCFATLDSVMRPEDPETARRIEKAEAYKRYLDEHGIKLDDAVEPADTQQPVEDLGPGESIE